MREQQVLGDPRGGGGQAEHVQRRPRQGPTARAITRRFRFL
jgi:hypothetical protein